MEKGQNEFLKLLQEYELQWRYHLFKDRIRDYLNKSEKTMIFFYDAALVLNHGHG